MQSNENLIRELSGLQFRRNVISLIVCIDLTCVKIKIKYKRRKSQQTPHPQRKSPVPLVFLGIYLIIIPHSSLNLH